MPLNSGRFLEIFPDEGVLGYTYIRLPVRI